KAVTVRSENGPENCVIDCQWKGRGFIFHSGEDEKSVLDGFTITKGFEGGFGGGIRCTASSPTIANCIFTGNFAGWHGGGMCNTYNSAPTLTNCIFSENSAESPLSTDSSKGGGMCNLENSNPTLTNCVFSKNFAKDHGAGMYNCENSSPTLIKCTFSANSAVFGGGVYNCYDSTPSLVNCTFSGNSAEYGGAIKNTEAASILINCTLSGNSAGTGGGIHNGLGSSSKLTNCILWGSSDSDGMDESAQIYVTGSSETLVVNYCCIQGWTGSLGGIGNFDADPLFADPNAGDFRLKSQGWRWDSKRQRWHYDEVTSQCIDAGNPGSPLNDELLNIPEDPDNMWGINLRINMGAYGGTAGASMPPYDWTLLGDLTNDGNVNFKDYALQLQYFMKTEDTQPGDLNRDGIVDTADLALLTEDWVKYIKPPVVNIVKPQNNTKFNMYPVEVEIEAEASDINGSVVKVEFFVNTWKIGEDNDGSDGWRADWNDKARGGYNLTARATDSGGVTATSPPVKITVIPPQRDNQYKNYLEIWPYFFCRNL
ncbi:MAG: Ig-like domain-containing protein, partial [Planctomycetota bacterium]